MVAGCRARAAQIAGAEVTGLSGEQRARLDSYRAYEEWMAAFAPLERVVLAALAGGPRRRRERVYPILRDAAGGGAAEVRLTPVAGRALRCGAVVEPVAVP